MGFVHSISLVIFSTSLTSHNMCKTLLNSFDSTNCFPQKRTNFVNQPWITTLSSMFLHEFSK